MIRLSARQTMPDALRGATIAMGNFDGVHLGHQAVIRAAIADARRAGRPAIVATFDPHPVRHFRPETPPFRLTTLEQRQELFAGLGADAMLVFEFDAELASMSGEDFVDRLLVERFAAQAVVTGRDFTFGRGRTGSLDLLEQHGRRHGLRTIGVAPVADDSGYISSSRVREALRAGDPQTAARLMTRPFAIRGQVIHGDKRGRTIGYPTANLELGDYLRPCFGIYAVTARVLDDGTSLQGAANIGVRPSFDPPKELLEPYFFDFSGDLYGREIEVAFHHFLRPEAKFDTIDALVAQMERDCETARNLLSAPL